MRAVVAREYGDFDVLAVVDLEPPPVSATTVRVAVRAAGVNPADNAVRAGWMNTYMPATPPIVLGFDVAGIVEEVGSEVTDLAPGDPVVGSLIGEALRAGSFAEIVVADAVDFVAKPVGLDFVTAAAVPHAGLTAAQAIEEVLEIQPGEVLLVHAGAGGVGSFAIQLARRAGATVLATGSAASTDYLTALGATPIRYDQDIVAQVRDTHPAGVDAILDLIAGPELEQSLAALRSGGRLASAVDMAIGRWGGRLIAGHPDRDRLALLVGDVASGELTVRIDRVFPLDRTPDALRLSADGHVHGKLVIDVAAESDG